jgi:hypothetical protein
MRKKRKKKKRERENESGGASSFGTGSHYDSVLNDLSVLGKVPDTNAPHPLILTWQYRFNTRY